MVFHIFAPSSGSIVSWNKRLKGRFLRPGSILGEFKSTEGVKSKIKSAEPGGFLDKLLAEVDESLLANSPIISLNPCGHEIVMKDLCAACGRDLRIERQKQKQKNLVSNIRPEPRAENANLRAVHNIPELLISSNVAENVAQDEINRLHKVRKLVLLVDLDQTIIHTTQNRPSKLNKHTISFQLNKNEPWLWTRLRPNCCEFIAGMSKLFEMHIVTFGSRTYAHQIARILEDQIRKKLDTSEKQSFFSHRILSRDECVDPYHKSGNLKHLFPAGDSMVAIIDDRGDVWKYSSNCILVKKYHFFADTGDINDPHAFKNTKAPTASKSAAKELPNKDIQPENKSIKDETDKEAIKLEETAKSEDGNTPPGTPPGTPPQGGDNEVSLGDNDADTSPTGPELPEAGNSRDSNSREAAEELNKTVEEEIDDDKDVYLFKLEEILTKIHSEYFKNYDSLTDSEKSSKSGKLPDVRNICDDIRTRVLAGCKLVLSGVVPNNMRPEDHRFYKNAVALGAKIQDQISPDTTHLVCFRSGTAKFREAKKKNIKIVHPSWLWVTYQNWERQKENDYPLDETHQGKDEAELRKLSPGPSKRDRPERPVLIQSTLSMDIFSHDDIAEMDKEVEEILSSEDDDEPDGCPVGECDNGSDDGKITDEENDEINDLGDINELDQADDADRTLQDDLDMSSDSDSDSNLQPESKKIRLDDGELDSPTNEVETSRSSEEWDDNKAQLLDEMF